MNLRRLQNFRQEIEENLGDESENLYGYIKDGCTAGWAAVAWNVRGPCHED